MGQVLATRSPAVRHMYDEASAVLGYDLAEASWNGPKSRLDSTVVSQPALFVASLAALETLRQDEPAAAGNCVATAGLSLGEYTALAFADALSFTDGLRSGESARRSDAGRGRRRAGRNGQYPRPGRCGH